MLFAQGTMTTPAVLIADEDEIDAAIDRAIQRATESAVYTVLARADAPSELVLPPDPAVPLAIDAAIEAAVEAALTSAIEAVPHRYYDLHDVWRRPH